MDWSKLSFNYIKTNTMVVSSYKDGNWSAVKSCTDDQITLHGLSASLHYGLECFEGLKAFNGIDGKIRIFRIDECAARLQRSANYLGISAPSNELFTQMVEQVVRENKEFIPPYETRGSLYIRPTLLGIGAQMGLTPSKESLFMILVNPVGSYGGARLQPTNAVISREYDRAAPNGSGSYKVGGNYASAMLASLEAQKEGYGAVLYLDPKENQYIDEFSSSNFFAIKGDTYVTPLSKSVLPSITNKSLEQIAADLGMETERRKIPVKELATFNEVGECGTAVVITPVWTIDDKPSISSSVCTQYTYNHTDPTGKQVCGPKSLLLYNHLTGIQYGEIEDTHKWCTLLQ